MLTNNYYAMLGMCLTSNVTTTFHPFTTTDGEIKSFRYFSNQASSYIETGLGFGGASYVVTSVKEGGIIFGDGDTAPTPSDYTISGKSIKGLTISVIKTAAIDEPGNIGKSNLYTITNGTDSPVTIKEIAYIYNMYGYYGNNNTLNSGYIMLDRTVLDAPITIEPGSVGQITYTINLGYPT